jgi:hypothetical protein
MLADRLVVDVDEAAGELFFFGVAGLRSIEGR